MKKIEQQSFVFHFKKSSWKIYIRDEVDQSVFNEIFRIGEYRCAEQVIVDSKDTILDIGAHAGFFSLYCRSLNTKAKILAIEPEPENFKQLEKHIKLNKIKKIETTNLALGLKTGEGNLIISEDSHNHFLSFEKEGLKVRVLSFSDLLKKFKIKKISLMKMDIEGGEYDLFNGMISSDFNMVNSVILEYHNGGKYRQIEQKLRENGFGVQIFPSKYDKTMGFIWAKNKRNKK